MTWHLDSHTWHSYASGRLDPAAEASVETHVAGCAECRNGARVLVTPATVDAVWTDVRATISAPTLPRPLRVLRRARVREGDLVVVSAADSLLLAWAVAVGFAVACAFAVGFAGVDQESSDAIFLALAPLVPVLAVVASYDSLDRLRELALSTPFSKLRLALLRATAALTVAVPSTLAVGLLVPNMSDLAFVWLAPSLGLTVGALVLLTWFEPWVTGVLVASTWVTVVVALRTGGNVELVTTPAAQAAFVAGSLALALALVLRTSTLRLQGGHL